MATFPDYMIRVIARACITRYNNGEFGGNMRLIVEYYGHSEENNALIFAQILAFRPDIVIPEPEEGGGE